MNSARVRGLALLVGLSACGPLDLEPSQSTSQGIVGGNQDAGALVNDVFLEAFTFSNGTNTICSGTLIAPYSIVTAAHCVDPARQGAASVTIKVTNKPTDQGLLSSDLINVTAYRLHPNWSASATAADFDIALLLLARSPTGVTPRPFNRTSLTGFSGQPITLVGYGRTNPSLSDSGIRRLALAAISSVASQTFDFGSDGTLGICAGDSGGPSLHLFPDSVERLIGVHSLTTSPQCGSGSDTRIDFHAAFIDTWLSDHPDPIDAGPPDAGLPSVDAGTPDAGPRDSGTPDAGPRDSGTADAGSGPDSGAPPDAGSPPTAEFGDPCVQGVTLCTDGSVCAAPEGLPTICRAPCGSAETCPALAHCEVGAGAVRFCAADVPDAGPAADAGVAADAGPAAAASGGCQCHSGPGAAALWALMLLARLRPAARRASSPARR